MKITNKSINTVRFEDITIGEVFEYEGIYYFKYVRQDGQCAAMSIYTGSEVTLFTDEEVTEVTAELIVS